MRNKFKGNAALLITAMAWGSGFIARKLGNAVMPPLAFNATRQIMAAAVLMPVLLVSLRRSGYFSRENNSRSQLEYKRSKMIKAGLICGALLLLGTDLQQVGLMTVSAGKSGFITAMYIAFVPVLSAALGVRVKMKSVVCTVMALFGFAVMSLKGGLEGTTAGDWLTLLGALSFAAQIIAVNHFVDKNNSLIISVLQMAVGGIAGLILSIIVERPALSSFIECMPVLLYSTLVPTALGYTLQIVGQKYADSSTAALILSLESVFAAVFGALFLKEMMSFREIAGSMIILAATVIGQIEPKQPKQ